MGRHEGLGIRDSGSGFGFDLLGLPQGSEGGDQGFEFGVEGLGFGVWSFGFGV